MRNDNALHFQGVFGFRGKRPAVSEKDERSEATTKRTKKGNSERKSKKRGRKDKGRGADGPEDLDMFIGSGNEDDQPMREQYAVFKSQWAKVQDVYTQVLQENFAGIIEKVGSFVDNCGMVKGLFDSEEG